MMNLKTKWFSKWANKNKISDEKLLEGINNIESGYSSSNLGSNIYKVRIARSGEGKSGGFRTILVYNKNNRAIFLYGFSKNEQSNITKSELYYFKKIGNDLLKISEDELLHSIKSKALQEVKK